MPLQKKKVTKAPKNSKTSKRSTGDRNVRPAHKNLSERLINIKLPPLDHFARNYGRELELMTENKELQDRVDELERSRVNVNIDENTVINMAGKIKDAEANFENILIKLTDSDYNYSVITQLDNRRKLLLLLPGLDIEFYNDGTYKVGTAPF